MNLYTIAKERTIETGLPIIYIKDLNSQDSEGCVEYIYTFYSFYAFDVGINDTNSDVYKKLTGYSGKDIKRSFNNPCTIEFGSSKHDIHYVIFLPISHYYWDVEWINKKLYKIDN